uniref:C2H2-type domain-containing protein n=1 Tax=Nothobranchius furzeri TaxID=105023 RepID=A0A1A8UJ63_NOTFU
MQSFVDERLTSASKEILAFVEKIVAAYEAEASGFRREISLQRRQLELLQPRASTGTEGLQTDTNQGSAEEEESHDPLKSLDPTGPSSSPPPALPAAHRKPSRHQRTINLRVRVLEDSSIRVLSKHVMKKSPVVSLKCPPGLQEAGFLHLLRSAVPQLAGDNRPFDVLTSDKRRGLQPLVLHTVTPEEIQKTLKSSGSVRSTVYVRVKTQPEPQEEIEEMETCEDAGQASSLLQEVSSWEREAGGELLLAVEGSVAPSGGGSEEDMCDLKGGDSGGESDSSGRLDGRMKPRLRTSEETKNGSSTPQAEGSHSFTGEVRGDEPKSEDLPVKHTWSQQEEVGGVCGESVEVLTEPFQREHRPDDCPVCGETFTSVLSLNEHVAAHSGEKPHLCEVCHATFALKESLEDHQRLHEPGHTCPTCQKVFGLEVQLKAHLTSHHKRKLFLCGVCGRFMCDKRSLSRHKMTHSAERPHSCQTCGRGFKLSTTLRQHEKIHTNRQKTYLCDICCKMFHTSMQLSIHMRSHTNEKPYHCVQCGKGFSTKDPLKNHMRIHTGEKPYSCSHCGWAFKRKSNLDEHLRTHTGAKPHVCGICGKKCARKTYLNIHMRTHNGERPYKCPLCDKTFTQSHCLKTHAKSHQTEEVPVLDPQETPIQPSLEPCQPESK